MEGFRWGSSSPFIAFHGPLVILLVAFLDKLDFPFPSEFMFLKVGAVVAHGKFSLGGA